MQKTLQNVSQVFPLSSFIAQKSRIPKSNRWIETVYGITFSRKQASRILFNLVTWRSSFSCIRSGAKIEREVIQFLIWIWSKIKLSMKLKMEQQWVWNLLEVDQNTSGSKFWSSGVCEGVSHENPLLIRFQTVRNFTFDPPPLQMDH